MEAITSRNGLPNTKPLPSFLIIPPPLLPLSTPPSPSIFLQETATSLCQLGMRFKRGLQMDQDGSQIATAHFAKGTRHCCNGIPPSAGDHRAGGALILMEA